MTTRGLYTGSFDPVTFGHVDIMARALKVVDELIVGVGRNSSKATMLSPEGRKAMLERIAREELQTDKITANFFSGLAVDFAKAQGVSFIIRGLRDTSDMNFEAGMAGMNHAMNGDIETIFLLARPAHSFISSTLVRQVYQMGGDISLFVPQCVIESLSENKN